MGSATKTAKNIDWVIRPDGKGSQQQSGSGEQQPQPSNNLPIIPVTGRDTIELVHDVLLALQSGPCEVYGHGFDPIRIARTNERDSLGQRVILRSLTAADLVVAMAESARFQAIIDAENDIVKNVRPPRATAVDILHYGADRWGFPPINAIVETPSLLADGRILSTPGYDADSQLYYAGPVLLDLPDRPTRADAIRAANYIREHLLSDFPTKGEASHANLFGGIITPVARQACPGPIPICIVAATQMASGKTLYANLPSIVSTGFHAATTKIPDDDAEMNKLLVSVLRQNPASVLVFDNCTGCIGTPALDMLLTSQWYRSRLLGVNEEVTLRQSLCVYATGNNIYVRGDTARRAYWIRLQPDAAPDFTGRKFKHERLDKWALDHRQELLQKILTMCRAWYVAGRPDPQGVPRIVGYEEWSQIVGGILEYAGVEGFLSTFQADADEASLDQSDWAAFLVQLYGAQREVEFTAGHLVGNLSADENAQYKPVREACPKSVLEALDKGKPAAWHVGGLLLEQSERIHRVSDDEDEKAYFDFKLIEAGRIRSGVRKFRVLRRAEGGNWSFESKAKGAAQ